MGAAGEMKIRLRLDTGDAKRERDSFLSGFGGGAGGSAVGGFLGAYAGARMGGPTASGIVGSFAARAYSTFLDEAAAGPSAWAQLAGQRVSASTGADRVAFGVRSHQEMIGNVTGMLGMAAAGMSPEQIRAFAAPMVWMGAREAQGATNVRRALGGAETIASMTGMDVGATETAIQAAEIAGMALALKEAGAEARRFREALQGFTTVLNIGR